MLLWFLSGIVAALYSCQISRSQQNLSCEETWFLRGCYIIASMQVAMTLLLSLKIYTTWTQCIILGIPWLFVLKDVIPLHKQISRPSFKPSWHHIFLPLFALGYIWYATPPPWMRDSLTYHLALAKQYAISGKYIDTDFIVFSHFPQGWQSVLTAIHTPSVGTALFNPRYLSVAITIGTALGLFGWIKRHTDSQEWALTAACLYLLTPSVIEFGTSCYVQPWLTAVCFWLAMKLYSKASWTSIGFLTGLACSLKYSALIIPVLILPLSYLREKQPRNCFQFLLGVLGVGLFFYIRNLIHTGNPFFPLMYDLFGGEGWDSWRAEAYDYTLKSYGFGREFQDYILLPIRMFSTMNMSQYAQGSLGVGW